MTQHVPVPPLNLDPRIAAILRQRAQQGITILQTKVQARTQATTPGLDIPHVSETEVGDAELAALLARLLPQVDALVREAITHIRSDGRLTIAEALALAPEIRNIISMVVAQGLPQVKGRSAYDLVVLMVAEVLRQYVGPHLPAVVRPYLTAAILRLMAQGLQFAYDNWVKPQLK